MKILFVSVILSALIGCTAMEPTDHYKDPEFIHGERESGYSK